MRPSNEAVFSTYCFHNGSSFSTLESKMIFLRMPLTRILWRIRALTEILGDLNRGFRSTMTCGARTITPLLGLTVLISLAIDNARSELKCSDASLSIDHQVGKIVFRGEKAVATVQPRTSSTQSVTSHCSRKCLHRKFSASG